MKPATAIVRAARRLAGRDVPAADDNQPGRNGSDLASCQGIAAEPLTDPDISRRANNYLRRKEGEL